MPKKKYYRARAHSNPLNDTSMDVPLAPEDFDWSGHFPAYIAPDGGAVGGGDPPAVRFADVGCGFGGMTIALAKLYPDTLVVGMELRDKVCEYVKQRIVALRAENAGTAVYQNCTAIRCNAMKYLCNYFRKEQLTKLFFLFPDPHFKAANHRRRIVNTQLITEYAYFLQPGGIVYTITDVEELGAWMKAKLDAHPMFEPLSEAEMDADPAAAVLATATEEGKKVARNGGSTWRACYRRLPAPVLRRAAAGEDAGAKAAAGGDAGAESAAGGDGSAGA